jgi:hypothetical protein
MSVATADGAADVGVTCGLTGVLGFTDTSAATGAVTVVIGVMTWEGATTTSTVGASATGIATSAAGIS